MLLKDIDSTAIIAVTDMTHAREFYGRLLGLEEASSDDNIARYHTGRTSLVVYKSDNAGTNKANAVVWGVGRQIDAIVADLLGKGIKFEHYPEMGMDYANGIHSAGSFKAAWFKDPDGNILHLNSM
ncbi:VOC family protein [Devosia epidermidihirudinis]|uniref:VOC family protein n=1 Tax=Devosia epidermidihirudinis TaxID=1293439 RepID=UPI000A4BB46B|nr:VOC family protein [Devosia epidermidihirudinis]